ncbi:hypothetical protein JMN32_19035 [Fulvivirga sp. 29W222]|uniref:TIGR02646 family protein n=1 Tax=Fulvivirga marina TaxID=2494733 RepID=A0A937G1F2_9BACT|nr:hypothetical protein [Fulvivirga marina]MBL6448416.1 hypothetical protein [Fulvivirga marina]
MLKFTRPDAPNGFENKSKQKLDQYKEAKDRGDDPDFNDSFWGEYKGNLFYAQNNKCGYCEKKITESYGDVEHYRPKSTVEVLPDDKEKWGKEQEPKNNVKGRIFENGCEKGYWWLAYSWDNYLLSCSICNQPWKRALFPIAEDREPNEDGSDFPFKSPVEGNVETPLLLNPFDETSIKFSDHLSFTEAGLIKAKEGSRHGFETIRTCGLDRPSITDARSEKAKLAYSHILKWSATTSTELDQFLANTILEFGNSENEFAGMVRIIFEEIVQEISWEEFEELYT